jgi:hypothetical protein
MIPRGNFGVSGDTGRSSMALRPGRPRGQRADRGARTEHCGSCVVSWERLLVKPALAASGSARTEGSSVAQIARKAENLAAWRSRCMAGCTLSAHQVCPWWWFGSGDCPFRVVREGKKRRPCNPTKDEKPDLRSLRTAKMFEKRGWNFAAREPSGKEGANMVSGARKVPRGNRPGNSLTRTLLLHTPHKRTRRGPHENRGWGTGN